MAEQLYLKDAEILLTDEKEGSFQSGFLKRHSLIVGIVLMFIYTWTIDLSNSNVLPFQFPFVVYITLGWGFIFASVLMTGLTRGRAAVFALLKRYTQWRVGIKWFLAAVLLEPVFIVAGVYINSALTQFPVDFSKVMAYKIFGQSANLWLYIIPYFLVEIITNGEEMGWRGYVLPRLQAKYSALTATVILGLIWGFWHLPKFLAHFDLTVFAWFMLHIMAYAFILTWLYNNTQGSLLMAAISHAVSNTFGVFFPIANTASSDQLGAYIIYVVLECLAAVILVAAAGPARLSRTMPKQIQE